jgi:protein SCO1/2
LKYAGGVDLTPFKRRPAALALGIAAACLASGCGSNGAGMAATSSSTPAVTQTPGASGFDGAALPSGIPAPANFTLRDLTGAGAPVSLSSYRGRVTIVAFPYSACGATCAVIAQQIRGALDELPRPVPVLLISADPDADTPARARGFLADASLGGRASYLSGTRAQLRAVWRSFRVVPASAGRAAFDRSASVFLLDRAGRERVIFQLEQLTPEALSHDVRKLLGRAGTPLGG